MASIPAAIAGAVIYFAATSVLAYALTRAVGNAFLMHFESGGILLTFDPKAFAEYFANEFKMAGGVVLETAVATAAAIDTAAVRVGEAKNTYPEVLRSPNLDVRFYARAQGEVDLTRGL